MLEWLSLSIGRKAAPLIAGGLIVAGVMLAGWLGLSGFVRLVQGERDAYWQAEVAKVRAEATAKQAGKNERAIAAEAETREREMAEQATRERERSLALESELVVRDLERGTPLDDPIFYPAELPPKGSTR